MDALFNCILDLFGAVGNKPVEVLLGAAFLVLGFVCLVKGSDWFVDGAVGIASRFGIPQIVIGLTIVAMGTSAPEAAVSITGAFSGSADTSVGNVVGSNILNVLIILGLSAVIRPLLVDRSTVFVDTPVMIGSTVLLLLLGIDGTISRLDGVILLAVFAAYMVYLMMTSLVNKSAEEKQDVKKPLLLTLLVTVVGLAVVILGSQLAVAGATSIARAADIKESFIGLTVVALGTSLPELFTSVSAARKGNADIAIGNAVGSNVFNVLLVLGLSGVITDVGFAPGFIVDTAVAIGAALLLLICCLKTRRINRFEGALMLACYGGYFTYLLLNL